MSRLGAIVAVLAAVGMTWVVVSRAQSAGEDEAPVDIETLRRVWGERNDVDAEIRRLHSEYPLARARAAARLRDLTPTAPEDPRITDKAVPDLVALLGDDTELRATDVHPLCAAPHPTTPGGEAAMALRRIGPAAADALLEVMRTSQDAHARRNAAYALGGSKDGRAVEPLIAALGGPDAEVRAAAARSLGRIGDPRALEPLIRALQDDDAQARYAAAETLARTRNRRGLGAVFELLLHDPNPEARTIAAAALRWIETSDFTFRWREPDDGQAVEAAEALAEALLHDDSSEVRAQAADCLGDINASGEGVIEALAHAVRRDQSRQVRERAASALAYVEGDSDSRLEPILAALADAEGRVRAAATSALSRFRDDDRAMNALAGMVHDDDEWVRTYAVGGLQRSGDARAVGPLLEALEGDASDKVRGDAASALCDLGVTDPRIIPALDAVLTAPATSEHLRQGAAVALSVLTGSRYGDYESWMKWWEEHRADYVK